MSRPVIPGYLDQPGEGSLADLWARPAGVPAPLWPVKVMRAVHGNPTDWVTVTEHYATDTERSGTRCVLVGAADTASALEGTTWLGSHLGQVDIVNGQKFEDGLADTERGVPVEFFAQVRRPSGATAPVPEISHPFLWYWDAFPVHDGWKYLDGAGRVQDLVRQDVQADRWRIEVRALELRHYLAVRGRSGLFQIDHGPWADVQAFERVDDEFTSDWANFSFYAVHDPSPLSEKPAFSRLLGRYLVRGARNSRVPRVEEWDQDHDYPEFVHHTDQESGQPVSHTCDPDQLGSYFDSDDTRLHYLTPVYFKREVLQPYAAEPGKYALSATRLSCLGLWGIDISFNSVGLVEVYLGDIGAKLPAADWGHWKSYNVPPQETWTKAGSAAISSASPPTPKTPPAISRAPGPGPPTCPRPCWAPRSGSRCQKTRGQSSSHSSAR